MKLRRQTRIPRIDDPHKRGRCSRYSRDLSQASVIALILPKALNKVNRTHRLGCELHCASHAFRPCPSWDVASEGDIVTCSWLWIIDAEEQIKMVASPRNLIHVPSHNAPDVHPGRCRSCPQGVA